MPPEAPITTPPPAEPPDPDGVRLAQEIRRRKTFAIISHPDAGKTTLTEKLLLYGGAIQLAGAVKAKRGRASAVSDWMDMERERGISITSSVLQFPYRGLRDEPPRHARPRRLQRGHLPHAPRRRRRGDAPRLRQGRRGADEEALSRLQAAEDAHLHLRQQDGPARAATRSIWSARWRTSSASASIPSPGPSTAAARSRGVYHRATRTRLPLRPGARGLQRGAPARRSRR